MRKILSLLSLLVAIAACGGDPASSGRAIADQTFDLPAGNFVDFRFTIDTDVQQNAFLQGRFSVEGGSVQMAVMNGAEFIAWTDGGTPGVLYSPGTSNGDSFRFNIDESDVYYIVFSNNGSSSVTVKSEIFLLSSSDQGELAE